MALPGVTRMPIVCGTDFSEESLRVVAAAAHLAARLKTPLHLVHALDVGQGEELAQPRRAFVDWAEQRFAREVERLRSLGAGIEVHVEVGVPDEVLLEVATQVPATLIIVGSMGRRRGKTTLGGHADRIAQRAHLPVLVVRDLEPFEHWARESKPLRIVLGADSSRSCELAMSWINELRAFGPCDVIALQLYWPPEQFHRLGLAGVRSYVDADPAVSHALEREFGERMSGLPGSGPVRYRSEPHLGRIGERLALLAVEENADLVVVGSHPRNTMARLWEGSVSREVLQSARCSVACVPLIPSTEKATTPKVSSVLCATDFSAIGDTAIPMAYATVAPGGTVHLVHIVETSSDPIEPHDIFPDKASGPRSKAIESARGQLSERVPHDAQGKRTQVHVLESDDPAAAICQAAERLRVDLVCLGTHGRSGVQKVLLGSVAQKVLSATKRPVLITHAPA